MTGLWTIAGILQWATEYFTQKKIASPRLDAEVLIANALGVSRLYLYTHYERPLNETERAVLRTWVKRRAGGESVAVITGVKEFMGLSFAVTPDVLVPRPETETLVDTVLTRCDETAHTVVDVGTGTGAILLSLLYYRPSWIGMATDLSAAALEVAKGNAEKLELAARARFVAGDLLTPLGKEKFDILVSNPPYIRTADLESLEAEVRHEPRLALDGGEDGLRCYRQLVAGAATHVTAGGLCAVEIGWDQAAAVTALVRADERYTEPRVEKDLGGHERVVLWTVR